MAQGKFIVLEGIDGAGTTTQTQKLKEHLLKKGFKVKTSHEPTGFAIGQEIRNTLALLHPEDSLDFYRLALLFAADRLEHVKKVIIPSLKEYDFVLLDRYVMSSLVYQGLNCPLDWVESINRFAVLPGLTIVLDIPAEEAIKRLKERNGPKDFFEEAQILEAVRQRYLEISKKAPFCSTTKVLSVGCATKEEVFADILATIENI